MLSALDRAQAGELDPLPEGFSASDVGARLSRASLNRSRRRTGVAALVALLLGFAATALLLSRQARRDRTTETAPAFASSRMAASLEIGAPLVVPVESTVPAPSASVEPRPPAPKAKRPAASASKVAKTKPGSGVIQGLELNTKGP
jgi:hypothetical protein